MFHAHSMTPAAARFSAACDVVLAITRPDGEPMTEHDWHSGYATTLGVYLNGEGIQVIHQPAAHTDGDTIVFFRRGDVIATGDIIHKRMQHEAGRQQLSQANSILYFFSGPTLELAERARQYAGRAGALAAEPARTHVGVDLHASATATVSSQFRAWPAGSGMRRTGFIGMPGSKTTSLSPATPRLDDATTMVARLNKLLESV